MKPQNHNQAKLRSDISLDPKSRMEGLKVTDNMDEVSEQKLKDIPISSINPDNNAAFEEKSNPLSSKGN